MPVAAIEDKRVLADIVGRVERIEDIGGGAFRVRIGLSVATTGPEPGQLINMLFGNTSIHDDVTLEDAILPPDVAAAFGGPNHGLAGLRARCGAATRAMTCSALKPQGLAPEGLAGLARRMAEGGIDFIKDDHGLAQLRAGTQGAPMSYPRIACLRGNVLPRPRSAARYPVPLQDPRCVFSGVLRPRSPVWTSRSIALPDLDRRPLPVDRADDRRIELRLAVVGVQAVDLLLDVGELGVAEARTSRGGRAGPRSGRGSGRGTPPRSAGGRRSPRPSVSAWPGFHQMPPYSLTK